MNEKTNENTHHSGEVNLLDYIIVIVKQRKLIIYSFLITSIVAVVFSLMMPKTYKATAVVMPPGKNSSGLLSSLSANLPFGAFGGFLGGGSEDANTLLSILGSRTLAEKAINKFELQTRYNKENLDETLESYYSNLFVSLEEEGTIIVSYNTETGFFHPDDDEAEAQHLCADIVNYLVHQADSINVELKTEQAKSHRIFIEEQFTKNKETLAKAEEALRAFSEQYRMIDVPEQIAAVITAAAKLESDAIIKDIELSALKATLNVNHPNIKALEIEQRELRKKLAELIDGDPGKQLSEIFPALSKAPELSLQFFRLKRDVEVQNLLYQFFTQQYEQAKIEEAQKTPTLQVIDNARVPERKFRPIRSIMVLIAATLGILFGIFLAFLKEFFGKLPENDPDRHRIISQFKEDLKKDILGRKSGRA